MEGGSCPVQPRRAGLAVARSRCRLCHATGPTGDASRPPQDPPAPAAEAALAPADPRQSRQRRGPGSAHGEETLAPGIRGFRGTDAPPPLPGPIRHSAARLQASVPLGIRYLGGKDTDPSRSRGGSGCCRARGGFVLPSAWCQAGARTPCRARAPHRCTPSPAAAAPARSVWASAPATPSLGGGTDLLPQGPGVCPARQRGWHRCYWRRRALLPIPHPRGDSAPHPALG